MLHVNGNGILLLSGNTCQDDVFLSPFPLLGPRYTVWERFGDFLEFPMSFDRSPDDVLVAVLMFSVDFRW